MAYTSVPDVRDEVVQTIRNEVFTIGTAAPATTTQITLKDQETKELTTVTKNGTVIITGFTFVKPNKITFSPALTVGDIIEIARDTYLTDTQVTLYITDADSMINASLATSYTVPFSSTPPFIATISRTLAAAMIRRRLFDSTERDGDKRGFYLWREWTEILKQVATRAIPLVTSAGVVIAPISTGMLVDPTSLDPIFDLDAPRDVRFLTKEQGIEHPTSW